MKNNKIRGFLQQSAIKTGAIVLASALVLTSSVWSVNFRNTDVVTEADLPTFVDTEDATIPGEGVPSGKAPKVTRKKKTTKKTKKVKLKKVSKKTYTKKSKAKKQTTTEQKVTSQETTTVKTETSTTLTSKFKKGSKINTQTTTVTTVTTTTVQENGGTINTNSTGASSPSTVQTAQNTVTTPGEISIGAIAPRVDSRVSSAYTTLGFKININPSVNYSGMFDARSRSITLKSGNDAIYHELGHFVAFIAGNVDQSASFKQIFSQERSSYTAFNKNYVLQNSSEYFAESFRNYTLDPGSLRASRPQTYAAIDAAVNKITNDQVKRVGSVYRVIWGA